MIDINDLKFEIATYMNLIIATNERKNIIQEKIDKFGEPQIPAYELVEFSKANKDIESYQDKILQSKSDAIKEVESEIRKNIDEIRRWRAILKDELKQQKRIVDSIEYFVDSDEFDNVAAFQKHIKVFREFRRHDKSVEVNVDRRMEEIFTRILKIREFRKLIDEIQGL